MAVNGKLKINLKAIQDNYKFLDSLSVPSCSTGVSIKANAYGLGIDRVAPALFDIGVQDFFVATLDEGTFLRSILSEVKIYVLNGFLNSEKNTYRHYNLIPVLNSLDEIKLYKAFACDISEELPAVIHFDTAMNRLGLPEYEAKLLCDDLSLLEGINLKYIMSHFSSSDEKDNPVNEEQYKKFSKISSHFKNTKLSLSNSGGIFLSEKYHMDLTRPGIALYGGSPVGDLDKNPMNPVVSLNAPLLQIKSVKKGEFAGYNGSYCFDKNSDVAIISIGYADGFLRSLSNKGYLYWKNYKMPVCGRVSMDLVICDLGEIPQKYYPKIGDMVEIIGNNQKIDHLAKAANTISYEILTSLGSRYERSYICRTYS